LAPEGIKKSISGPRPKKVVHHCSIVNETARLMKLAGVHCRNSGRVGLVAYRCRSMNSTLSPMLFWHWLVPGIYSRWDRLRFFHMCKSRIPTDAGGRFRKSICY